MNFSEASQYLLSLGNEVEAMKLGLRNIRVLLKALGDPQKNYLKVQVAGTNGKGSVCAFLDSICREAGIKTGIYTSPHLISITERIRIGGEDISEEEFARLGTVVRETSEKLVADGQLGYIPTFFEQMTAIGLLAFAEASVELAILETGLGGRYDAVTAANAEIAAITQIALDHQEYLGDTIEKIAAEKAAIINVNTRSVIVGEQKHEQAMQVILDRCQAFGIVPSVVDMTVLSELISEPGLSGRHQRSNSETAVLVIQSLKDNYFNILPENIAVGLKKAKHPGRLEFQGKFLFDGAHNTAGAEALREYLDEFAVGPITLIFGAMKEKDVAQIADILFPKAENIIFTQPKNSRAMSVEKLADFLPEKFDRDKAYMSEDVASAINTARRIVSENGRILVTGSLYLVGEVKKLLNNQNRDR